MPTTALLETFGHCSRFTEPWSATGAKCCKAAAGTASVSPGRSSVRSRRDVRCCVQNCDFLTESCRPSQCCEPPVEERGAGKPHATFCGNRGRATAPGDPVVAVQPRRATHPYVKVNGTWCYLYRAIDREGTLVDVYLSETR